MSEKAIESLSVSPSSGMVSSARLYTHETGRKNEARERQEHRRTQSNDVY